MKGEICVIIIILSVLLLIACTIFSARLLWKEKPLFRTAQEQKETFENDKKEYIKNDFKENATIAIFLANIVLALFVLVSGVVAVTRNIPSYRDTILEDKALIIYKIENGEYESDVEMLEAISEFNAQLNRHCENLDNYWINWYYSRHYATVEPINYRIDIPGVSQ